jgi:NhaP-type Na+/H+ and K+/H+ antiporter
MPGREERRRLSRLDVPLWLAAMIVAPMLAFALALYLGNESGSRDPMPVFIGIGLACVGSGLATACAPRWKKPLILKMLLGVFFGAIGFALTFAGAVLLTTVLK